MDMTDDFVVAGELANNCISAGDFAVFPEFSLLMYCSCMCLQHTLKIQCLN